MPPYEVILVPALLVVATSHLIEAWRWIHVIRRRPAFRRKLAIILLTIIAICNLIAVWPHAAEAARYAAKNVEAAPIALALVL